MQVPAVITEKKTPLRFDRAFQRWLAARRGRTSAELRRELEQLDVGTLDRWAFGVAGGEIIKLSPRDLTIVYLGDLEEAKRDAALYPGGLKQWAKSVRLTEPILVRLDKPNEFVVTDGHHRYLAARLTGQKLLARVGITGKPVDLLLERAKSIKKTPAQLDQEIKGYLSARKKT